MDNHPINANAYPLISVTSWHFELFVFKSAATIEKLISRKREEGFKKIQL